MRIEDLIREEFANGMQQIYGQRVDNADVPLQVTRQDFEGDYTIVVFPFLRFTKKSPEETAHDLGEHLLSGLEEIGSYNVIKGFLNISLTDIFWMDFLAENSSDEGYGLTKPADVAPVVLEYSSPNTNKPLHLGHIRNNLLGWSVAEILKANGYTVEKVNLINDRGIHICKTMVQWQSLKEKLTPEQLGIKGDKYIGSLYVSFERENRAQMEELMEAGMTREEAMKSTPLIKEAVELLQKWEAGDEDTRQIWEEMNNWVYKGFDATYERMGIDFDKVYHESDTYLLGKKLVEEGLEKEVFFKKDDGSVWVDLKDDGLDEKLLLRADGTSVYMTQDLGTAQARYDDFSPSRLIYVVGNEQNYHFDVLQVILKKLGRKWADHINHLSYGMVELPEGRMKSREGKVVDADDLMDEMHETARKMTEELGKTEGSPGEAEALYEMIGIGALKYFIIKVDPKKNMLFNPEESIDFNGNTGPFIQYTHARISSLLRKGKERGFSPVAQKPETNQLLSKERQLLRIIARYPGVVKEAGDQLSPALVANYTYELAREFNQYYQETQVLREPDRHIVEFRLGLVRWTGWILKSSMGLLGIVVPERM